MKFRLLHLHSCPDLCFGSRVAEHCSVEADLLWSINEEDIINRGVKAAFVKDGAFKGDEPFILLFRSPKIEVLQDSRVDDGVDLTGILDVGKEVIGKELLVELSAFEHLRTDKSDELLANLFVCGGESLGFSVAVIDLDAEMLL